MPQAQILDPVILTNHIEKRYHARHREQLPRLTELATKVEEVHSAVAEAPHGLAEALHRLHDDLEAHMRKEEVILFPAMRQGGMPGIAAPIAVMRGDHEGHAEDVARLRALAGNLVLPEGACRTWATLYAELGAFLADFEEHMRTENETLFPMFER